MRAASDFRRRAHVRRERDGEALAKMVDPSALPDQIAAERQAREVLLHLLEGLDGPKHSVFVLYEIEGLEAPEIGELMGCSPKTIYTRLHAARKHFSQAVARMHARQRRAPRAGKPRDAK
jgi:RNA polymerase sigma-70 factor (ECF subfamily)